MNYKDEVLEIRKQRKVSVKKLSEITGIPADRIYKWESGVGNPKVEDSEKLQEWLTGPIDDSDTPKPGNKDLLYDALVTLMRTQNDILADQKVELVDRVRRMETNLNMVAARAESLQYDLVSGRDVVLRSLARLEGVNETDLLHAADKMREAQAVAKNELYKSGVGSTSKVKQ